MRVFLCVQRHSDRRRVGRVDEYIRRFRNILDSRLPGTHAQQERRQCRPVRCVRRPVAEVK